MRRFVLTGALALTGLGLFAQSAEKANDLLKAGKLTEAKAEIDKVMANEKNQKNGTALFYEAKIYNAIAASPLSGQFPGARDTAFMALQKYVAVDDKKTLLLMQDNFKAINDIYQGYFGAG
ncbi:MAG TPA: hypothetical protein VGR89_08495, partial [Puia sp.]|nr:hypothetical protein [Puia sp.]